MKKALIAGAATSIALAAMPVLGTFAATQGQDSLTVSIGESCNLDRAAGTGSYSKTMQLNSLDENFGTSTYRVICNNAKGFYVTATFTDLDDSAQGENITYSATTPVAGSGTWTAAVTADTSLGQGFTAYNINPNSEDAAAKNLMNYAGVTPADGYTATVVYKVSTRNNQAQGSYTGTATYILNKNS